MKKLSLLAIAIATVFASCTKVSLDDSIVDNQSQQRKSGVLADPPELKKNLKFQVSNEFGLKGRTVSFVNGKRTLDVTALEADELFKSNAQAKPSKGSWSGGSGTGGGGGGTTSGGGTTTPTGDITAPRIMITSPTAGAMYDLKSFSYHMVNWRVVADDETRLTRILVKIKSDVIKDTSGYSIDNLSTTNVWTEALGQYYFPYGDGTYDMTAQAWDAKGNTTVTSIVFYRNTQMTVLPVTLPSAYTMPHITDGTYIHQGQEGACAAFTVASAYAIDRYNKAGLTGGFNGNNIYSPEWIYNISLARGGFTSCGVGSGILGNISTIVNRGVPTWSALPFSDANGCDTSMFTQAIRDNAALNKATWGTQVATLDRNLIKYNVYKNKPGMFGFQMDSKFISAYSGYIWTFPHLYNAYTHAMVVVGYDDSKNAYLCLNSWGTDWATAGRIWIDYDFFEQNVTSACTYFGQ